MECYVTNNLTPGLWMVVYDPHTERNHAVMIEAVWAGMELAPFSPEDPDTAVVQMDTGTVLVPEYNPDTSVLSDGQDKALIRGGEITELWYTAMGFTL